LVVGFVGFGKRVLPEKKTIKLTESKAPRIIPTLRDKKKKKSMTVDKRQISKRYDSKKCRSAIKMRQKWVWMLAVTSALVNKWCHCHGCLKEEMIGLLEIKAWINQPWLEEIPFPSLIGIKINDY
jgi:hypothetical protein